MSTTKRPGEFSAEVHARVEYLTLKFPDTSGKTGGREVHIEVVYEPNGAIREFVLGGSGAHPYRIDADLARVLARYFLSVCDVCDVCAECGGHFRTMNCLGCVLKRAGFTREPAKVRSVETLVDYQNGHLPWTPESGVIRLAAGEYRVSLSREVDVSDLRVELYVESDSGLTTTLTATGRAGDKWLYVVGIKDANGVGTDHRFHLQLLGEFVEPGVWTRVPAAPAALSPELQALAETSDRLRAALRSDDEIQVEAQLLLNAAHDVLIAATAGGTPRSPSGLVYEAILHTAFNLIDAIKNFREALRTDGRWNELGLAEGALVRALDAAEKGRP